MADIGLFDQLEYPEGLIPVTFREQVTEIHDFVKKMDFQRTLEIGLGAGGSAVYIMAATGKRHVSMDPYQKSFYGGVGLRNVKKMGFEHTLEHYEDYSCFVLPYLIRSGRRFDFIYVDGDHKFDSVAVDFYFSNSLLEQGGYVLLDDSWMPSVDTYAQFIKTNLGEVYEECPKIYPGGTQFRKGERPDERKWDHYMNF